MKPFNEDMEGDEDEESNLVTREDANVATLEVFDLCRFCYFLLGTFVTITNHSWHCLFRLSLVVELHAIDTDAGAGRSRSTASDTPDNEGFEDTESEGL